MHNLYPHFGSVATCYLLVRVCIHRPAVELGRVETNSRAESSLVEWSGEDQLMLTPECSSCSGGLVRYLEWIGFFRLPSDPRVRECGRVSSVDRRGPTPKYSSSS